MTLEQFHNRIRTALVEYKSARRKLYTAIALDSLAAIKKRVQDKGENAQGQTYEPYSTNDLPAWYYLGKSRGEQLAGGGRTYSGSGYSVPFKKMVKQQSKAGKGFSKQGWSYKEWREANNLQTEHKDFSFTGKMWKNVKVALSKGDSEVTYRIAPTGTDEIQKMEWNEDQQGEILALSDSEKESAELRAEILIHRFFDSRL